VSQKSFPAKANGGLISAVGRGSLAAKIGIRPGDRLLEVNGHPVEDVIDVQYHSAEDAVSFKWKRGGRILTGEARRTTRSTLGLDFVHPTFDTDIRRCNNRCPFCFVVQMAPGMRRTLHIKDDDYRYSFLYGHFVTLTNLSARDWSRIAQQRLSPLYVSVHATEPEVRARALGNPKAGDILERLRYLAENRIEVHTQVVLTPGWNDGEHLERTLRDLAGLFPSVRSCSVVPVGVTRFQKNGIRPYDPLSMETVIRQVEAAQQDFLHRLGSRFTFLTDEWYLAAGRPVPLLDSYEEIDLRENGLGLTRNFLEDWYAAKNRLPKLKKEFQKSGATLVTGKLFQKTLESTAEEFSGLTGIPLTIVGVANRCFGETVTVAGLLTARDVIDSLKEKEGTGPVLLPQIMFCHPGTIALDDLSPLDVARAVGSDVYLVDTMSGVAGTLFGKNSLRFGARRNRK
jgi:putative radical SAM enzyme (TIGR03279 family)